MALVRLLLRAAVAPQAGELVQQPHLTTRAAKALMAKVLMSLTVATRVETRAATEIVASASLPPTNLPTTLRAAVGAAGALAAVVLVVLVAPETLALGVATFPGTRFGSS